MLGESVEELILKKTPICFTSLNQNMYEEGITVKETNSSGSNSEMNIFLKKTKQSKT